jgi:hypothetical protein
VRCNRRIANGFFLSLLPCFEQCSLRPITAAALLVAVSSFGPAVVHAWSHYRNQPGDPGYPTVVDRSTLNDTIGGGLLNFEPSAEACRELGCTEAQWESGVLDLDRCSYPIVSFMATNSLFLVPAFGLTTGGS